MLGSVWQSYNLVSISQRPRKYIYAFPTHLRCFGVPKMVPEGFVGGVGDASIESRLLQLPTVVRAYTCGQQFRIEVRPCVTERLLSRMAKILAVKEGDGANQRYLIGHQRNMSGKLQFTKTKNE